MTRHDREHTAAAAHAPIGKRRRERRRVTSFLTAAASGLLLLAPGNTRALDAYAVSDGDKIDADVIRPALKRGNSVWERGRVKLLSGRGETVSFQIVTEATGAAIRRLTVQFAELAVPRGAALRYRAPDPSDPTAYVGRPIQIFPVNYMDVREPSKAPWIVGYTRTLPDPLGPKPVQLVPENARAGRGGFPLSVPQGRSQSVWIDVHVPKGFPAGVYTGKVTVRADAVTMRIPVELEVVPLTLPDRSPVNAMVYHEDYQTDFYHGRDVEQTYHRFAHKNRVELVHAYDAASLAAYRGRFDGSDFTASRGYEGPGAGVGNVVIPSSFYTPPPGYENRQSAWARSDEWVRAVRSVSPSALTFLYLADEPTPGFFPGMRLIAGNVKSNPGPGRSLPTLTAHRYLPELDDAVDYWVSSAYLYDAAAAASLRSRGKDHWIYNGGRPATGAVLIDSPGTDPRAVLWTCFKAGVTTYMYWHGVHWFHNAQTLKDKRQNVWRDPVTFDNRGQPDKPWSSQSYANGDGVLMYPGEEVLHPDQDRGIRGPVGTFQLANIRRGVQDYAYLSMARSRGLGAEVSSALSRVVPGVLRGDQGPVGFSSSGDEFEGARRRVIRALVAAGVRN